MKKGWKNRARRGVSATAVCGLVPACVGVGSTARAEDHGAWQNGCAAGKVCFERSACDYAGDRISSAVRDSYFPNDHFGSGLTLNDNADCMRNSITTLNVRAYGNADYSSPFTCIGVGTLALPSGSSAGASSFKSC